MDFFDLLAPSTPQAKKQKIGEHGESPQLTPDMKECEGAHSTDVKNDVFEEEHGPAPKKLFRRSRQLTMPVEQRLKKWKLDKEFTVRGGSRLGCITCMKYGAWCEQEADTNKKKKKNKEKKETQKVKKKENKEKPLLMHEVHTEEVKSPMKSHMPAEADSGDEETTHADIQQALQKGTYHPAPAGKRLRYYLHRHLSRPHHEKAAGARDGEENVRYQDVPSDAQMMFVYDAVKKSPMVPHPPRCLGDTMDTMG